MKQTDRNFDLYIPDMRIKKVDGYYVALYVFLDKFTDVKRVFKTQKEAREYQKNFEKQRKDFLRNRGSVVYHLPYNENLYQ